MPTHEKQATMPKATVAISCDECGARIAEIPLSVNYLAAVLFKLRKEHAKECHGWKPEDESK